MENIIASDASGVSSVPNQVTNKINLDIIKEPYFFIKWALDDKRYRVSASFKYLNTKYGLHINIIRDLNKIAPLNVKYLLSLLKNQEKIFLGEEAGIWYSRFIDPETKTEIYYIEREWENTKNFTIVFFSLNCWSLNDYLRKKGKKW